MAYTAYYQISRLVGEVTLTAVRAERRARRDPLNTFWLKDIRKAVRSARQFQVEINDIDWNRLGGVESQCIFTGMLASLRITDYGAKSLRDTDQDWTSRIRVRACWKRIFTGIADHFCDLAETDDHLSGDPYWICIEVRTWLEAWRDNLQVYFNT